MNCPKCKSKKLTHVILANIYTPIKGKEIEVTFQDINEHKSFIRCEDCSNEWSDKELNVTYKEESK